MHKIFIAFVVPDKLQLIDEKLQFWWDKIHRRKIKKKTSDSSKRTTKIFRF